MESMNMVRGVGLAVLQIAVVAFLVLLLLWGSIEILRKIFRSNRISGKSNDDMPVVVAEDPSVLDDGALVAAITAAIAAFRIEQGESREFRVVSFKRARRR